MCCLHSRWVYIKLLQLLAHYSFISFPEERQVRAWRCLKSKFAFSPVTIVLCRHREWNADETQYCQPKCNWKYLTVCDCQCMIHCMLMCLDVLPEIIVAVYNSNTNWFHIECIYSVLSKTFFFINVVYNCMLYYIILYY